jgi:TrpR-related protein YerC/YecD
MKNDIWQKEMPKQFAAALANIDSGSVMQSFLRDVMTEKEILELSARFEAAKMLSKNEKYTTVINKTRLSSRTVARISEWLKNGNGGYAKAIVLSSTHHEHIPPARA